MRKYIAMLNIPLIVIALIVPAYVDFAYAEQIVPIVVINNNDSYYRGTFPRNGVWLGLYCNSAGCELRNTDVRIKSSQEKDILEQIEKTEVLRVDKKPVGLFYGVQLKPGPVTTWFRANKPMYKSGHKHYNELKKLGHWNMPWGTRHLTISRERLPDNGGVFHYHVSNDKTKQLLFVVPVEWPNGGNTTPFIYWVGDLDGDGMIDLLLSIPGDGCDFDERLYLSSESSEGEHVREAAKISGSRPACGC